MANDQSGKPVYLRDIWPTQAEVSAAIERAVSSEGFRKEYATVSDGDASWQGLSFPTGDVYQWEPDSTYIRQAPYFDGMTMTPAPVTDITGARVLAVLGDSVTTDHISPAGSIKANGPAGKYLAEHGVQTRRLQLLRLAPRQSRSHGARHLRQCAPAQQARARHRRRRHAPAARRRANVDLRRQRRSTPSAACPLIILAGKEYGSGSSRDWAAKGPKLLGVRAVIAESFERIHRSNLVGMGILPLQFEAGQNAESLGLTGEEVYDFPGLTALLKDRFAGGRALTVTATSSSGPKEFDAMVRIDTPQEIEYYKHGGILQYVLRQLAAK